MTNDWYTKLCPLIHSQSASILGNPTLALLMIIRVDEITNTQNRNHSNDQYLVEYCRVKEAQHTNVEQTINQSKTILPPIYYRLLKGAET